MDTSKTVHSHHVDARFTLPRVIQWVGKAHLSRAFCVALGFALAFNGGNLVVTAILGACAILTAIAERAASHQAAAIPASDIIAAAVAEYEMNGRWPDDEYLGRHAAIRGILVRLNLYKAFDPALEDRIQRERA